MPKLSFKISSALIAVSMIASPVLAQSMNLEVDQSNSLRLPADASGIVVGNPGVADVIVHEPRVLLFIGKSVGTSSVLVVGKGGRKLYSGTIRVTSGQSAPGVVTIQRGASLSTAICESRCVQVGTPEDSAEEAQKAYGAARARAAFTSGK
jgi:Flp pilus assembly secretin CpaC